MSINFFDVVVFDNLAQNESAQELSTGKGEIIEDYAEFSSHNLPRVLNYIGQSLLDGYCIELYQNGNFVARYFDSEISDEYEI